jgi:site-specific recombinase XerD
LDEIIKNIEEELSIDEIAKLQSILIKIKQSKEQELSKSETLYKFSIDYLKMVENTFSEKYYTSIQTSFNHLISFFGNECLIIDIKPRVAETFKHFLMKTAPNGYLVYIRNLKAAFNRALTWELISINPFAKMEMRKRQAKKPEFINKQELDQILRYVKNEKIKQLYLFAFFTGARLSESVNLRWKNINMDNLLITIGDDEFVTKNKKIRVIPIAKPLEGFLRKGYQRQKDKNNYVFCKSNGFPFRKEYISKIFKKAVIDSGIEKDIHFHSLRHSFASNLVLAGSPITVVSELLGHSSILVTQIYSHTNLDSLRAAVGKFN